MNKLPYYDPAFDTSDGSRVICPEPISQLTPTAVAPLSSFAEVRELLRLGPKRITQTLCGSMGSNCPLYSRVGQKTTFLIKNFVHVVFWLHMV